MGGTALPPTRRTFVVSVHADGSTTVEDVRSGERRPVGALADVPDEIGGWLETDPAATTEEVTR